MGGSSKNYDPYTRRDDTRKYCSACNKYTDAETKSINIGSFLDMVFFKCRGCGFNTSKPEYKPCGKKLPDNKSYPWYKKIFKELLNYLFKKRR